MPAPTTPVRSNASPVQQPNPQSVSNSRIRFPNIRNRFHPPHREASIQLPVRSDSDSPAKSPAPPTFTPPPKEQKREKPDRWVNITKELPPQLSRRQSKYPIRCFGVQTLRADAFPFPVSMISIGLFSPCFSHFATPISCAYNRCYHRHGSFPRECRRLETWRASGNVIGKQTES